MLVLLNKGWSNTTSYLHRCWISCYTILLSYVTVNLGRSRNLEKKVLEDTITLLFQVIQQLSLKIRDQEFILDESLEKKLSHKNLREKDKFCLINDGMTRDICDDMGIENQQYPTPSSIDVLQEIIKKQQYQIRDLQKKLILVENAFVDTELNNYQKVKRIS